MSAWGFTDRLCLRREWLDGLLQPAAGWSPDPLIGWRTPGSGALLVPELQALFFDRGATAPAPLARLRQLAANEHLVIARERHRRGRRELLAAFSAPVARPAPVDVLSLLRVPESPLRGRGVTVAVLDSGCAMHPDLAEQIDSAVSFVDGEDSHDRFGHGTACAGLIAGAEQPCDGAPRYGVAPAARLLIAKIARSGRQVPIFDPFLAEIAFAWAIQRGADLISMSFGFPRAINAAPSVLSLSLARQLRAHPQVLALGASGNGRPRTPRFAIANPACAEGVLAIAGALADGSPDPDSLGGDDWVAVGALAPSFGADSTSNVALVPPDCRKRPMRQRFHGTSAATAIASGIAALHLEGLRARSPQVSAAELRAALQAAAQSGDCEPQDCGMGLLRAPT